MILSHKKSDKKDKNKPVTCPYCNNTMYLLNPEEYTGVWGCAACDNKFKLKVRIEVEVDLTKPKATEPVSKSSVGIYNPTFTTATDTRGITFTDNPFTRDPRAVDPRTIAVRDIDPDDLNWR
jgi:ribosomal protein L37AE/L43A